MSENKIYVTQPYLPPLEDFSEYLKVIWKNKILTNGGPLHQKLEEELCKYLEVDFISLFNNGTSALITALQALEIDGEVITTPYSFIATAHSLLWNRIKPVFIDIDPVTLNLDPNKIEGKITSRTKAILAVHCYGQPCDVQLIEKIAQKNNLKVIYDAAHAFGVKHNNISVLRYGDLSILSFHATKIFNTFEGGAIISGSHEMKKRIDQLKNFGIVDENTVEIAGINGKMSEINAAFGLTQLKYIEEIRKKRLDIHEKYCEKLNRVAGINCVLKNKNSNNSYFPILVEKEYRYTRDELYDLLKINNIYARKYFYPLITDHNMYEVLDDEVLEAKKSTEKILCLPIYPDLKEIDINNIIDIIKNR